MSKNNIKECLVCFLYYQSFSESLAREAKYSDHTKCLFLNDEPCMARLTIIDLNYYY